VDQAKCTAPRLGLARGLQTRPLREVPAPLAEVRLHDGARPLIFDQTGFKKGSFAKVINASISARRPVPGPGCAETVTDLELENHQPPNVLLNRYNGATIFDYWASW
jgi:hypothetical protein